MIYALLATNLLTIVLFVGYLRTRDKDAQGEREKLYQRIQAPAVAVAQSIPEPEPGLQHVPLDDDAAFNADRAWVESGNGN